MVYFLHILLRLCTIVVFASPVVITEVMWVGSPESNADEWIELQLHPSFTGAVLPLSGIELWSNDSAKVPKRLHVFTEGEVIVAGTPYIVANYSAEQSVLNVEPQIVTTNVSLLNTGLLLWLQTASGDVLDVVDDGVSTPFAGGKILDGTIYASMERKDMHVSGTVQSNWVTAVVSIGFDSGVTIFGTPGVTYSEPSMSTSSSDDSSMYSSSISSFESLSSNQSTSESSVVSSEESALSSIASSISDQEYSSVSSTESSIEQSSIAANSEVIITEILPNPTGDDASEWIEILNTDTEPIDVSRLKLQDTSGVMRPITLSGSTVLESNSYALLTKDIMSFVLKNSSGSIFLYLDNQIIDQLYYPEAPEGVSFGKLEKDDQVIPYCIPTPGNAPVADAFTIDLQWQTLSGIVTQSGGIAAENSLTFNLLLSNSGSTPLTQCSVTTSDSWASTSCNPPSHTISQYGSGSMSISVQNYCGTTVQQNIEYFIENTNKSINVHAQNNQGSPVQKCIVTTTSSVRISEVFPDPTGDELEEEWIEIVNENSVAVSLCGWSLDDGTDGGKPYVLDTVQIAPQSYLRIPRKESKIALNNTNEAVRLFAPYATYPVQTIAYNKAVIGESYALREDGNFLWTPFITPGERNIFRSVERRFASDTVVVSAALPNPDGKDFTNLEWIEVANVSDSVQNISGYSIDNRLGSSVPYRIESLWLEPGQTHRFSGHETGIELSNSYDEARLLDPDGYVLSSFEWSDAESGYIYRLPRVRTEKVWATVMQCIDGDTLRIAFDSPDELRLLPKEVERVWLMKAGGVNPELTVRLLGIDTPETVHPFVPLEPFGKQASDYTCVALQSVRRVQLQFDEVVFDKYNRLLAYVYVGGELLQSQLLRRGLATAYIRFPFALQSTFTNFEAEARIAQTGMWQVPEVSEYMQAQKEQSEIERQIETEGLRLRTEPKEGIVEPGTVVQMIPSVPSNVYVALGSGQYLPYEAPIVITGSTTLRAYAVYTMSGADALTATSAVLQTYFTVRLPEYPHTVRITEVYPSPKKGEEEWIELHNAGTTPFDLTDYILDDTDGKGSKPYVFPWGTIIEPNSILTVKKSDSHIVLNNSNDVVILKDPLGNNIQKISYGKVPTGKSIQPIFDSYCISDVPTPLALQSCITLSTKEGMIDRDFDGLADDYEQYVYKTDPAKVDTDTDGFYDGFEVWAKTDPVVDTTATRDVQLLYKKFIQKNVRISFKEYKIVLSKLTVKNTLPFDVHIHIADNSYTVHAAQTLVERIHFKQTGEYAVNVELPTELHQPPVYEFLQLNTLFVQNKSLAKQKVLPWAKFTERYIAMSTNAQHHTSILDLLLQQRAKFAVKSMHSHGNVLGYSFGILGIVALAISTWYWRQR